MKEVFPVPVCPNTAITMGRHYLPGQRLLEEGFRKLVVGLDWDLLVAEEPPIRRTRRQRNDLAAVSV
jgi:hypothetical protein